MPRNRDEEDQDQENQRRIDREVAYRRGWTQGSDETARLVLQLVDMGFKPTEIRRLIAAYDDHVLQPWRVSGDLTKMEPAPFFEIDAIQEIVKRGNYDHIQ